MSRASSRKQMRRFQKAVLTFIEEHHVDSEVIIWAWNADLLELSFPKACRLRPKPDWTIEKIRAAYTAHKQIEQLSRPVFYTYP